jgi:hypothetical protein
VGATNCCFLLEPGGRPRGRFSVPGVWGEAVGRVPGVWITSCVVPGAIYLRGLPLFRLAGSVLSMPPGVTSMLVPMPGNIPAMEWGPDSATSVEEIGPMWVIPANSGIVCNPVGACKPSAGPATILPPWAPAKASVSVGEVQPSSWAMGSNQHQSITYKTNTKTLNWNPLEVQNKSPKLNMLQSTWTTSSWLSNSRHMTCYMFSWIAYHRVETLHMCKKKYIQNFGILVALSNSSSCRHSNFPFNQA